MFTVTVRGTLKIIKKRSFSNVLVFVLLYSPTLILQPRPLFFNLDPNSSTATLILQPDPYSSTSTLILLPRPLFFNPDPYSSTQTLILQPRPLFFTSTPALSLQPRLLFLNIYPEPYS